MQTAAHQPISAATHHEQSEATHFKCDNPHMQLVTHIRLDFALPLIPTSMSRFEKALVELMIHNWLF